jgi:trimeric autotransporter adhesin
MKFKQRVIQPVICSSVVVLLGCLTVALPVQAGPKGGQIVGGVGAIKQNGLTTNIQQNTQNLAINWNSYNLNSNEKVNYLQPNSSSIALNRVLGGSASQIFGQINANGQVVLVNPNGILL